jgi:hypothetical protein
MQPTHKLVILILFLFFTGCTIKHDYVWKEYPLAPEQVPSQNSFTEGKEIRIIKGRSDDSKIFFGQVNAHYYEGSEQALTDGIVDQLVKEMRKKRLEIKNTAEKSLEIAVNHSNLEHGGWRIAVTLEFTVKFGNGKTKLYTVRNLCPAIVYRAYNGAVALAVIEIINDPEVLTYINE